MDFSSHFNSCRSDNLRHLVHAFGNIIDVDTIKEVAKQCNYDVQKSTSALLNLRAFTNNNTKLSECSGRRSSPFITARASRIQNPQNYISTFSIEDAIDDIIKGLKVLVLVRGLPGSGKTFLAKSILKASLSNPIYADHVFSADDFFMKFGTYNYDKNKIAEAHNSTQRNVFQKMLKEYSPLIVDNTNLEIWEMKPYALIAAQCGYRIHILEANTKWCSDCVQLSKKNQHSVPKAKIRSMLERYARNITPEMLLANYNLPTEYQNNPQMRVFPPIIRNNGQACVAVNSAVGTSGMHNHNSMNQDLKLPEACQQLNQGASRSNFSQREVSNLIEISDDDSDANDKVNDVVDNRAKSVPEVDLASWGLDENVLKGWDIVTPLNDENHSVIESTSRATSVVRPQTSDASSNTYLADFHRDSKGSHVIYGEYREINPPGRKSFINKPGMLDKSSSTQDDIISDRNEDLKLLIDIFPKIPPLYVRDMYDDCKGNLDLTTEIFLEDNKDYSNVSFTKNNIIYDSCETMLENAVEERATSEQEQTPAKKVMRTSGTYYNNVPFELMNMPCSSKGNRNYMDEAELPSTSKVSSNNIRVNKTPIDDEMLLDSDSDLEFENYSGQIGNDCTKSEENDFVEINLGNSLIEQLENEFGDPGNDYPRGFQPVVQVPKSFARQLYTFYVESVYQQMEAQKAILDNLVKEDEAFARKLYEEENGLTKEPPMGFRDIMNEQAAMNVHEKEISQWKNCTPNDLASQLTRKKLFATFPTVDRNILLEVFHANDGNYKQTVEDLVASVDAYDVHPNDTITDPPISKTMIQELEKAQEVYGEAKYEEEERSFQFYRDEANDYLRKRNELYQKAQEFYSQGQREVAQWYSQLAQKQTQFYEIANSRAATVLLEEHSQRLQNFDTLDLHFLFVKEAIAALDVFIDRNINLLNGGNKTSQNLLVITGRGNRSKNGLSRIKPAVISRLKSRKIQFVQLNPGLLKIKVNRNTIITTDL